MNEYDPLLKRWESAGVLDAEAASRIRAWESAQASTAGPVAPDVRKKEQAEGMAWQGRVALILGGILLASGVVLFVSAHWDQLGRGMRFLLVMAMVSVFHLGGAVCREKYKALSTTLHAVGTISTGAAIALVGQIFNIQEHWPAAILMWAIAAALGWMLLRDQAQQTLTLLLFPAWLMCEWSNAAENHIGQETYIGRMLCVWAILYLTFFIGTERRVLRGILLTVSAIAAVTSIFLLLEGWHSWYGMQAYPPFHTRFWGWVDIAAIPLLFSLIRLRKSTVPVLASIAFVIALPWCSRIPRSALRFQFVDPLGAEFRCACAGRSLLRLPHLVGCERGKSRTGKSRHRLLWRHRRLVLLQRPLRQDGPLARPHRAWRALSRRRMGA